LSLRGGNSPRLSYVCRATDGIYSILHFIPNNGYGGFRCGRIPDEPLTKENVLQLFNQELEQISGIFIPLDETKTSWDVEVPTHVEDYTSIREYFLDGNILGWDYVPKRCIPGQRWRLDTSWTSHEVSSVCQKIKMFSDGYLTLEDRIVRWGIVNWFGFKIQEFQREYAKKPEEWARVLEILDVTNEDIQTVEEFITKMPSLHPARDLIPIRVLETITVFRVMFRLSLRQFELAYGSP
jgi:hypothetical protein